MSTHPGPSARLAPWLVVAMLAMVAVPAAITLNTVKHPATLTISEANPTPYGYTLSLLLFIVPIVVIGFWFVPKEGVVIPRKAFWRTIAILVPGGFALDFFFAGHFFVFPNVGATLQIGAPALGKPVPIEEYVFYLTGFIVVLLLYVWMDEFWLAAYNVPDYKGEAKQISRLLQFHPASAMVAIALIAAGIIYKKFFSSSPEGFPGYFTFLVGVGIMPAVTFFPAARRFVNWRAFSATSFFILLVSLLWEATLALPYGWWGFQSRQMLGLSIGAWSGLPIEEVFVWIAVTYATVIVFEVVKIWQASEKPARVALLGEKSKATAAAQR